MTILDSIKYQLSDPPTEDELKLLPQPMLEEIAAQHQKDIIQAIAEYDDLPYPQVSNQ